jgi:hypothetical protein
MGILPMHLGKTSFAEDLSFAARPPPAFRIQRWVRSMGILPMHLGKTPFAEDLSFAVRPPPFRTQRWVCSMGILPMHLGKTPFAGGRYFAARPPAVRHERVIGLYSSVESLVTMHGQDAHATGKTRNCE